MSPSIVSGRVVAMMIFSSVKRDKKYVFYALKIPTRPLDRICKRSKNTEFELLLGVISGDI